ncbi:hypothetical protein N657DRAFT_493453 [Parathielavia appendiculata]|uniref:Uncharacterized protein n=1 Tax=Parathielavia appendiculata TaxID=2587402 RepID=A0AAN6Z1J9_9PEZI|nr:hypothetical protein N657DRAFT_493453 [Parathielavia appendiculata]
MRLLCLTIASFSFPVTMHDSDRCVGLLGFEEMLQGPPGSTTRWTGPTVDMSRLPETPKSILHHRSNFHPQRGSQQLSWISLARLAQSVERETLMQETMSCRGFISRLWVRPPRRAQFPSTIELYLFPSSSIFCISCRRLSGLAELG